MTRTNAAGAPRPRDTPLISGPAQALVRRALGGRPSVREIAGDASTRRFYRVAAAGRRAILMVNPGPLDPSSPQFSNQRIMRAAGIPVPRILAQAPAAGLVLMEDLGDTTLQQHLSRPGRTGPRIRRPGGRPSPTRARLYRQACDLIVRLQRNSGRAIRPGDFAARNALDRDRFVFELDHFHEHYLRGLKRGAPGGAGEAVLRAFYSDLAEACDRMPRVYCHRDFMSRNLMVRRGRLYVIDYQDARMGPYTYDAASLLRDSSLDLDEALVEECVARLADRLGEGPEEFRRDFDIMALERNLKELGTFGYMATIRGNRSYLEYVPRAVRSIRRTLRSYPRFHFIDPFLEPLL